MCAAVEVSTEREFSYTVHFLDLGFKRKKRFPADKNSCSSSTIDEGLFRSSECVHFARGSAFASSKNVVSTTPRWILSFPGAAARCAELAACRQCVANCCLELLRRVLLALTPVCLHTTLIGLRICLTVASQPRRAVQTPPKVPAGAPKHVFNKFCLGITLHTKFPVPPLNDRRRAVAP